MHEVNLKVCCHEETASLNSALELYADGDKASSRELENQGIRYEEGMDVVL